MLTTIMLAGGALYVGLQVYPILIRFHPQGGVRQITPWSAYLRSQQMVMPAAVEASDSLVLEQKIKQGLHLSLTALGLTAAGAFLYPPLGYAGTLIVIYLDLPFLVEAILNLVQEKRIGMSLLYSLVRTVALVEGAYLANALDVWLYYWTRQRLLQAERTVGQHFHDSFRRPARTVWVVRDALEIEVPLSSVETGDVVIVHAGELIPVDGVITQGAALLSSPFLCKTADPYPDPEGASVGVRVLASSCVLAGKIQVAVERSGAQTQVAQLEEWMKQTANGQTDWQSFGAHLADQMAIPMVGVGALAALALGPLGGITILNAKLGYDVSVLAPLALRRLLTMAYQEGILIKDPRVLEQVHQVDTVVFSLTTAAPKSGCPLGAPEAAAGLIPVIQALHQRNLTVICLLTADLPHALPQWATDLGIKLVFVTATEDKANVIERLRAAHHVVCYVGNGLTDAPVMQKADVAVSWCGGVDLAKDTAQVVFLDQRLNHLSQLFDLGHSFEASLRAAFLLTLTPGLLSVACAFLPNVGFAASILLENAGLLAGLHTATQPKIVTASHEDESGVQGHQSRVALFDL